jgi:hypothetical protein
MARIYLDWKLSASFPQSIFSITTLTPASPALSTAERSLNEYYTSCLDAGREDFNGGLEVLSIGDWEFLEKRKQRGGDCFSE